MAGPHAACLTAFDQPALFENLEVPQKSRQRDVMRCCKITDSGRTLGKAFDNSATGWVREGKECSVNLVSHIAKYYEKRWVVKMVSQNAN